VSSLWTVGNIGQLEGEEAILPWSLKSLGSQAKTEWQHRVMVDWYLIIEHTVAIFEMYWSCILFPLSVPDMVVNFLLGVCFSNLHNTPDLQMVASCSVRLEICWSGSGFIWAAFFVKRQPSYLCGSDCFPASSVTTHLYQQVTLHRLSSPTFCLMLFLSFKEVTFCLCSKGTFPWHSNRKVLQHLLSSSCMVGALARQSTCFNWRRAFLPADISCYAYLLNIMS
jgi:hypothetical protein